MTLIPEPDDRGLLPTGIHVCTMEQIKKSFGWNEHRMMLLDGLVRFLDAEWKPIGIECPVFIDGSFVRTKPTPSDIDIVIDLSAIEQSKALGIILGIRRQHERFKTTYHCDVWTRHPLLPNDLLSYFQYLGDEAAAELNIPSKTLKGLLRLLLA